MGFLPFSCEGMLSEAPWPGRVNSSFRLGLGMGLTLVPEFQASLKRTEDNNVLFLTQVAAGYGRKQLHFCLWGRKEPQMYGSGFDHTASLLQALQGLLGIAIKTPPLSVSRLVT